MMFRAKTQFAIPKANHFGRAVFVVGVLTLLSRLVGLLRTRIMTAKFGAGSELDIYFAAFRLPDLLMGVFIVGTLSLAALPIVTKFLMRDEALASELVSKLLNRVAVCIGAASFICAIFAPGIMRVLAPGFGEEQLAVAVKLTRIILSVQVLLALANLVSTVLNATKRFFWSFLAPVFYNLGIIVGVVWLYDRFGMNGLGYGVALGALMHFLIALWDLLSSGFRWQAKIFSLQDGGEVWRAYVPRLFFMDLSQVGLLLATYFGSRQLSGAIASYNLSFDLQAVPIGVIGVASAVAAFPMLTESYLKNDVAGFMKLLGQAAAKVIFYMAPISAALLVFRAQLVRLLYGAGQFDWEDTTATFSVLGILTFSLLGQSLVPLFSRALIARGRVWSPVITNTVALVIMVLLSWWLTPGMGVGGVAAAFVVAVSFNAVMLYLHLRGEVATVPAAKQEVLRTESFLASQVGKIGLAVLVFTFTAWGLLYALAPFFNTHTWLGLALQTGVASLFAGVLYLVVSWYFGLGEARLLASSINRLLTKNSGV